MRRSIRPFPPPLLAAVLLAAHGLGHDAARGETAPADTTGHLRALDDARRVVVDTAGVRMDALDLGDPAPGETFFSARLTNVTDSTITIAVDLRAVPGYWLRNFQGNAVVELAPGEARRVEKAYVFGAMTSRAALRVTLVVPELDSARSVVGWREVLFRRWFPVGDGNPQVNETFARFDRRTSEHFELFVHAGYLSEAETRAVLAERERAYARISEILGIELAERVPVFLYPDSATKTTDTGHVGAGLARGGTLVEIHNDVVRLDPYHELTHILAGELGWPPALFGEGLAVHVAERFGADALRYLGGPGASVEEVVRRHAAEGALFPLEELFALTDIGPEETRPAVAYPQAAWVVAHLVETYGWEPFRRAYATLESTDDPAGIARNAARFEEAFGVSLTEVAAELERVSR